MKGLIGLALVLLAPGAASAAGFDCAKASSEAEKQVCASPKLSALDSDLGKTFQAAVQAHPELADAIRLDQRHWLAGRDDVTWGFKASALDNSIQESLTGLYQRRIAVLKGVGNKPGGPLDAVQSALPGIPAGTTDVVKALASAGVLTLAKEVEVSDPKSLPFQADESLRKQIDMDDGRLTNRVLDGSPIGSLYALGGTANCYSEAPYRRDGNKAVGVDMPPIWGTDCMTRHEIARIGSDVVALRVDGGTAETTFAASRWQGKAFGPAVELLARFDVTLALKGAACAPKESPCDEFGKLAMQYATRYALRPQPGTIDRLDKGMDKAAYAAAVAVATAPDGIAPKGKDTGAAELPTFGSKITGYSMSGYASEATTFPIRFRNETLLGLIGHGHVGWRQNDDWLVSAWRLKGGKLEPVASAYIEANPGRILFSSSVPPTPRPSL